MSGQSEDKGVMMCGVDGNKMVEYAPEVVEGMQVNIGIGMIAGVGLLNFEDLVLEWTSEEESCLVRVEGRDVFSLKPAFTSGHQLT